MMTLDELHEAAQYTAAAALLAEHWTQGRRHEAALALGGGLAHAGWSQDDALHLMTAVCRAARDEEIEGRCKDVETSFSRLAAGKATSGWPSAAECLGEAVVQQVREWLGITDEPGLDYGEQGARGRSRARQPESEAVLHRRFHDIELRPIDWLWPGRIARGKVTMIAGNPGLGKS